MPRKITGLTRTIMLILILGGCQAQAGDTPPLPQKEAGLATVLPGIETPAPEPSAPISPVAAPSATPQVNNNTPPQPVPWPYTISDTFSKSRTDELSGVVFHPGRNSLFAVKDKGEVIEIRIDGTLMQGQSVRNKADFEGITYNPRTDLLYVVIEGEEVILTVDPQTLEARQAIPIDRMFEGQLLLPPAGDGIEGITVVPSLDGLAPDTFYLVNQSEVLTGMDASVVLEVVIDEAAAEPVARIVRYFSVGVTDLSGIHYTPEGMLLILSDDNDLLLAVTLSGQVQKIYSLSGGKQEGLTVDGEGFLYLAYDEKSAPLTKFGAPNNNLNGGQRSKGKK